MLKEISLILCSLSAGTVAQAQIQTVGSQPDSIVQTGWRIVNSGTTEFLGGSSYPSVDTLWAGGGTLLRSVNGGLAWTGSPTPIVGGGPYFRSASYGFVLGNKDTLYRTTDAGEHWHTVVPGLPSFAGDISIASPSSIFAVGLSWIAHSLDSGATWSVKEYNAPKLNAIAFADSLHGFTVGEAESGPLPNQYGGACLITTNGGITWAQVYTGANGDLWCIAAVDNRNIYIGGDDGIHASRDGGATWYLQNPVGGVVNSIAFPTLYNGYAVGSGGLVMATTDSGHTWRRQPSGTQAGLYSVKFYNDSLGIITGDGGTILMTTNGGTEWVSTKPSLTASCRVFPNPCTSSTQAIYSLNHAGEVSAKVFNQAGQLVMADRQLLQSAGAQSLAIPTTSLPSGAYLLQLTEGQVTQTLSFSVIK